MEHQLIIVKEAWRIKGRGVVLSPGLINVPKNAVKASIRVGDKILLKKPDGTISYQKILGFEWPYPNPGNLYLLLIDCIELSEVPIGTEIFAVE
jgi:hypothetical protein